MASPVNPVVLVTGANAGIGLTVVRALYKSSNAYTILLGSRNLSKGERALEQIKAEVPNSSSTIAVVEIDITSDEQIERVGDLIKTQYNGRLDILVNNAGANFDAQCDKNDIRSVRAMWNKTWDVNVSSTHVLTSVLAPYLITAAAPRLLFLTSGTACLAETPRTDIPILARINSSPAPGWPKEEGLEATAYRTVKTGLNMMMREWVRKLKNDDVKVWSISPGFLATGLGAPSKMNDETSAAKLAMGAGDPQIGGDFIRDVIEGKWDEYVGKAIRSDQVQEW